MKERKGSTQALELLDRYNPVTNILQLRIDCIIIGEFMWFPYVPQLGKCMRCVSHVVTCSEASDFRQTNLGHRWNLGRKTKESNLCQSIGKRPAADAHICRV